MREKGNPNHFTPMPTHNMIQQPPSMAPPGHHISRLPKTSSVARSNSLRSSSPPPRLMIRRPDHPQFGAPTLHEGEVWGAPPPSKGSPSGGPPPGMGHGGYHHTRPPQPSYGPIPHPPNEEERWQQHIEAPPHVWGHPGGSQHDLNHPVSGMRTPSGPSSAGSVAGSGGGSSTGGGSAPLVHNGHIVPQGNRLHDGPPPVPPHHPQHMIRYQQHIMGPRPPMSAGGRSHPLESSPHDQGPGWRGPPMHDQGYGGRIPPPHDAGKPQGFPRGPPPPPHHGSMKMLHQQPHHGHPNFPKVSSISIELLKFFNLKIFCYILTFLNIHLAWR